MNWISLRITSSMDGVSTGGMGFCIRNYLLMDADSDQQDKKMRKILRRETMSVTVITILFTVNVNLKKIFI
jgi:hypothetical protein